MTQDPTPADPEPTSPRSLTIGRALALYGAFAAIAWGLCAWLAGRHPLTAPDVEGTSVLIKLGLGVGLGVVVLIADGLFERFVPFAREMSKAFAALLGRVTVTEAVVYALTSSIAEEIVFRGAIQPWLGIIPASILFGLMHIAPDRRLWFWPIIATIMGFALGWLFEYTGDVFAPILAHFTINFFGFMRINRADPSSEPLT